MSSEGPCDFSFRYFGRILQALRSNFECHLIAKAPRALENSAEKPRLFFRHDVDLDLARALKMARIENDFGVRATYMVMVNSPFYRVEEASSQLILQEFITMGHEVALHFDFENDQKRNNLPELTSLEKEIHAACERLTAAIGRPVQSISFHRPLPHFLRGPLIVAGRVNAYAKELMAWYLSDSKGSWREGEPLPKLLNPDRPLLQLLIHPIWWADEHMSAEDRLQAFFEVATRGRTPEHLKAFDAALAGHLGVRRSGMARPEGE